MFKEDCCVKILNGNIKKYTDRAKELGYTRHCSIQNRSGYIKLYRYSKQYNVFDDNHAWENPITQEEFFGETMNKKMNPKGVLEVLEAFGYTHVCQNGSSVFAISGKVDKTGKLYACTECPVASRLLTVEIDWPDKENTIYPELPKPKFVEVKLNSDYTAKVYKDKIEVGCQTFPISVLETLNETVKSL